MGSFERKIRKNIERQAFNEFTKEWNAAKRDGQKRPDGSDLGSKPGFSIFKKRLKQHRAVQLLQQKLREQEQKKDIDLEWKEQ